MKKPMAKQYEKQEKVREVSEGNKGTAGKVREVMHEFKEGSLHSGKGGPVVKDRKQAIAISLAEAGMVKKMKQHRQRMGK